MSEPPPRRRPRISLLSLLLLMATIAFAIGLWQQRQSTAIYRRQIARLQEEVGVVVVSDPSKLTVQPLEGSVDFKRHFRWRAYLPPGHYGEVKLTIATDANPGVRRRATLSLDPGETGFAVSTLEHPSGKSWIWSLHDPQHHGGSVSGPAPPWFRSEVSMHDLFDPGRPPTEVAEGKQVELLRHSEVIPSGERVEVIVTIFHYGPAATPKSRSSAGTERLPDPPPSR